MTGSRSVRFVLTVIRGLISRQAQRFQAVHVLITAWWRSASNLSANEDFMIAHRVEIISLAARYRLPAVYPFRFFAELGGLVSRISRLSSDVRFWG